MNTRKQLKNGGDPRALADYAVLRDEMSSGFGSTCIRPRQWSNNWWHQ
ncbi:hypothetical protein [Serratia sp. DD3]|nr:hypothetical protein [Serratia sp. DD3]